MGMSIDEHIAQLVRVKHYAAPRHYETLDMAIDTMRKFQKIEQMIAEIENLKDNPHCCQHYERGIKDCLEVIRKYTKEQTV